MNRDELAGALCAAFGQGYGITVSWDDLDPRNIDGYYAIADFVMSRSFEAIAQEELVQLQASVKWWKDQSARLQEQVITQTSRIDRLDNAVERLSAALNCFDSQRARLEGLYCIEGDLTGEAAPIELALQRINAAAGQRTVELIKEKAEVERLKAVCAAAEDMYQEKPVEVRAVPTPEVDQLAVLKRDMTLLWRFIADLKREGAVYYAAVRILQEREDSEEE